MSVIIFGLETSLSIIKLFITAVIRDFRKVFESYITYSSRDTRVKVFLFTFLLLKPLFGLFSSLFKGFYITKGIIYGLGILGFWLRFFDSKVLHSSTLSLYLGCNNMNGTIALLSLAVYLLDIGNRLEAYFGFSFDCFLNHFFPNI